MLSRSTWSQALWMAGRSFLTKKRVVGIIPKNGPCETDVSFLVSIQSVYPDILCLLCSYKSQVVVTLLLPLVISYVIQCWDPIDRLVTWHVWTWITQVYDAADEVLTAWMLSVTRVEHRLECPTTQEIRSMASLWHPPSCRPVPKPRSQPLDLPLCAGKRVKMDAQI